MNYYRDEATHPITDSKSYKFKTNKDHRKSSKQWNFLSEFSFSLKHLSNFWKTLNIPLINCEVSLTLT